MCWSQGSVEAATYNWAGTCSTTVEPNTQCVGTATGVLTLNGGDPFNFTTGNFVSWQFNSSKLSFTVTADDLANSTVVPGVAFSDSVNKDIVIQADVPDHLQFYFMVMAVGRPLTTDLFGNPTIAWLADISATGGVYGSDYTFTETPLPAALPLFATGLGALGLLGWRRKRKNAAA